MSFKVDITLEQWFSFKNRQPCRWWELKDDITFGYTLQPITELYPEIESVETNIRDTKSIFTAYFESEAHYSFWLLKVG
jgi:hypothetical protein